MHTLMRRFLTQDDFEGFIPDKWLDDINWTIASKNFDLVKKHLPESFLQRRVWRIDYKTLQNMYTQRVTHKLPEWQYFLNEVVAQLDHPKFVRK